MWQEVFDNGDPLYSDSIVQVWKAWGAGWRSTLRDVKRHLKAVIVAVVKYTKALRTHR